MNTHRAAAPSTWIVRYAPDREFAEVQPQATVRTRCAPPDLKYPKIASRSAAAPEARCCRRQFDAAWLALDGHRAALPRAYRSRYRAGLPRARTGRDERTTISGSHSTSN
jgi:hypothetical protein